MAVTTDGVSVKTGAFFYRKSGFDKTSEGSLDDLPAGDQGISISNIFFEWQRYYRNNFSVIAGYRLVQDPEIKRIIYQAGVAGGRYYWLSPAYSFDTQLGNTMVNYRPSFSPYVEASFSIGRFFLESFSSLGELEASSEFVGMTTGLGVQFGLTRSMALDISLAYERLQSIGVFKFTSDNFFAMAGLTFLY